MRTSLLTACAIAALGIAAPATAQDAQGAAVEAPVEAAPALRPLAQTPVPDLVAAAKADDHDTAMRLLRDGADPDGRDRDGATALHWAAHYEDVELVRRLLREGADANARNDYGATAMQEAATLGNAELIETLLEGGADIESRNPEGQTALMAVARTGRLDAAQILIREGADVNAAEAWGGQTALMWAVVQRQVEMVPLLIDSGADVNARAIAREWERYLTSEPRIKELHTAGLTPLLYAAREGCAPCAQMLLDAGAEPDMTDPDGVSPLMLALMNMRYDTAAILIEAGADVNLWDRWGRTPLFNAVDTNGLLNPGTRGLQPIEQRSATDIAQMLLDAGAWPDMRLKLIPPERSVVGDRVFNDHILDVGATPLLRAAWGGDVEMVDLLLNAGARADIPNGRGATPIIAAVSNPGTRVQGRTEADVIATLQRLLDAGVPVNERNATGQAALHLAVRGAMPEVVRFLAGAGADVQAVDDRGLDLMAYASGGADINEFGTTDVVGVLPDMQILVNELTGQPIPGAQAGAL